MPGTHHSRHDEAGGSRARSVHLQAILVVLRVQAGPHGSRVPARASAARSALRQLHLRSHSRTGAGQTARGAAAPKARVHRIQCRSRDPRTVTYVAVMKLSPAWMYRVVMTASRPTSAGRMQATALPATASAMPHRITNWSATCEAASIARRPPCGAGLPLGLHHTGMQAQSCQTDNCLVRWVAQRSRIRPAPASSSTQRGSSSRPGRRRSLCEG